MADTKEIAMATGGGATSPLALEMLRDKSELLVKQTRKGCLQELLGCEAKNEFVIFNNMAEAKEGADKQIMYSLEESSFCMRLCCANQRGFTQTVWTGTDNTGEPILTISRPITCGMGQTCCPKGTPCYPVISYADGNGAPIGGAEIPCWCCVPAIYTTDPSGNREYQVQMPTCCGGMCVNVFKEGLCNCKVPFYVYKPGATGDNEEIGKIIKHWRGLGTELFTDADTFELQFPTDAEPAAKGRLLGTTFFINMLFFEKSKQDQGAAGGAAAGAAS